MYQLINKSKFMKTLPCMLLTTNQLLILFHILLIIFLNQKNNVLLLKIFTPLIFPFLPCNNNFPSPMESIPTLLSSWSKDKNWWITLKSKWLDNRVMACTLESFLLLVNRPFSSILNKCWSIPNKWLVYNNNNSCFNNNINNKWWFSNNKSNTVLWWLIKFPFLKLLEWCDLINEIPHFPIIICPSVSLTHFIIFKPLYINKQTKKWINLFIHSSHLT